MDRSITACTMPGLIYGKVFCSLSESTETEPSLSSCSRLMCSGVTVPGWRNTQSCESSIGIAVGFSGAAQSIVKNWYQARKSKARPRAMITMTAQPSCRHEGVCSSEAKYGLMLPPPEVGKA